MVATKDLRVGHHGQLTLLAPNPNTHGPEFLNLQVISATIDHLWPKGQEREIMKIRAKSAIPTRIAITVVYGKCPESGAICC